MYLQSVNFEATVNVANRSCRLLNVCKFISQPAAICIAFILQTLLTKTYAHAQLMVCRVLKVRLCFQQTQLFSLFKTLLIQ